MTNRWVDRRLYEFRMGHGVYLGLFLNMVSFLLIVHRLFIERFPLAYPYFGSLVVFTATVLPIYAVIAVLFGRYMWKQGQLKEEVSAWNQQDKDWIAWRKSVDDDLRRIIWQVSNRG